MYKIYESDCKVAREVDDHGEISENQFGFIPGIKGSTIGQIFPLKQVTEK